MESRLRVREGPTTDTPVVGYLYPSQFAEWLSSVPRWYEIRLGNGVEGYVSKSWSRVVPDDVAATLRIGAWNIKKLGHGSNKDFPLVAEIIEENFDILALIEVMQKQGGHPGYDLLLTELGADWEGVITATPRPSTTAGHSEFYAVVYRNDLVQLVHGSTGLTYHVDNDGSSTGTGDDVFSREPAFAAFSTVSGTFDFTLAAYHARWADGDAEEIADEADELDHVFDAMAAAFPGEEDHLIIGDYNLVPEDLQQALGMESKITGTGSTLNTTGGRTQNLYDHLLVYDDGETAELLGNGEVLDVIGKAATPRDFFKTVSDHLPIRAVFDTGGPDDD